jgi:hypothetical protein
VQLFPFRNTFILILDRWNASHCVSMNSAEFCKRSVAAVLIIVDNECNKIFKFYVFSEHKKESMRGKKSTSICNKKLCRLHHLEIFQVY